MATGKIENMLEIPQICVSSYEEELRKEQYSRNSFKSRTSPKQDQWSKESVSARGKRSVSSFQQNFRNAEGFENHIDRISYRFTFGTLSQGPLKGQGHSVGQKLWRKVSESLTLPLLYVKVKEKRRELGVQIGETLVKKQFWRRKFSLVLYSFQKRLLAKFRLAVKLTIFCSRNFKQHCLR